VFGLELVPSAVEDARANAVANNINNAEFVAVWTRYHISFTSLFLVGRLYLGQSRRNDPRRINSNCGSSAAV
jgi:hypothetical protein